MQSLIIFALYTIVVLTLGYTLGKETKAHVCPTDPRKSGGISASDAPGEIPPENEDGFQEPENPRGQIQP